MSFSLTLCSKPTFPWKICRIAPSLPRLFVTRSAPGSEMREAVESSMQFLAQSICPSVVSLATFFDPSNVHRRIYQSCRGGTGVFVDPTLIVTSAQAVGRISTWYESRSPEKEDGIGKGSMIHAASIGRTAALTRDGKELRTRPLAVNFSKDIAVLELVAHEGALLSYRPLASSPPEKKTGLMSMANERDFNLAVFMGTVRGVNQRTVAAKAPWPRDDKIGWLEHNWFLINNIGMSTDPPRGSILFNPVEKVMGSISRIPGAPWFDTDGVLIGISSWEVRDDPLFSVGFAVPVSSISSMLKYARTKGPQDPVVVDPWINSHVIDAD